MADVFISYSRVDLAFVRRLHDALDARGKDVWMDERDIAPSADWLAEIYAGIEGADDIVFVVSPESVASGICASEVSHAEKHGKRIVPIVVRELGDQAAPAAIAARNWIFFRESDSFDSALDTLVQARRRGISYIDAPTSCPRAGLPFEGTFKFADGSTSTAAAHIGCTLTSTPG